MFNYKLEGIMEENLLPIGSVVKLKGGQKRLMITGFLQVEQEENKKNVWDYSGCLYPAGMITSENNYVFNHSQIEEVYFTGLVDEEEEEFKKLDQLIRQQQSYRKSASECGPVQRFKKLFLPA